MAHKKGCSVPEAGTTLADHRWKNRSVEDEMKRSKSTGRFLKGSAGGGSAKKAKPSRGKVKAARKAIRKATKEVNEATRAVKRAAKATTRASKGKKGARREGAQAKRAARATKNQLLDLNKHIPSLRG